MHGIVPVLIPLKTPGGEDALADEFSSGDHKSTLLSASRRNNKFFNIRSPSCRKSEHELGYGHLVHDRVRVSHAGGGAFAGLVAATGGVDSCVLRLQTCDVSLRPDDSGRITRRVWDVCQRAFLTSKDAPASTS